MLRRPRACVVVLLVLGVGCRQALGIDDLALGTDAGAAVDPHGAASAAAIGPARRAFQSCRDLPTTCGPHRNENCCAVREVEGGVFFRGGLADYPASISPFLLDRFEITVARVRTFVASGFGTQSHPPEPRSGAPAGVADAGWDDAWNALLAPDSAALLAALSCNARYDAFALDDSEPSRAANCLDWYTAFAFCIWDGGRLPTEAEWEYAAAGGSEQRDYPWGSAAPDAARAAFGCSACSVDDILPVGLLPDGEGRWGHADLAGNLYEWTLDVFSAELAMSCVDCANLREGNTRVLKGGSFINAAPVLRTEHREALTPATAPSNAGARCAREP